MTPVFYKDSFKRTHDLGIEVFLEKYSAFLNANNSFRNLQNFGMKEIQNGMDGHIDRLQKRKMLVSRITHKLTMTTILAKSSKFNMPLRLSSNT